MMTEKEIAELLARGEIEKACTEILIRGEGYGEITGRHASAIRSLFASIRYSERTGRDAHMKIKALKPKRKLRLVKG